MATNRQFNCILPATLLPTGQHLQEPRHSRSFLTRQERATNGEVGIRERQRQPQARSSSGGETSSPADTRRPQARCLPSNCLSSPPIPPIPPMVQPSEPDREKLHSPPPPDSPSGFAAYRPSALISSWWTSPSSPAQTAADPSEGTSSRRSSLAMAMSSDEDEQTNKPR